MYGKVKASLFRVFFILSFISMPVLHAEKVSTIIAMQCRSGITALGLNLAGLRHRSDSEPGRIHFPEGESMSRIDDLTYILRLTVVAFVSSCLSCVCVHFCRVKRFLPAHSVLA